MPVEKIHIESFLESGAEQLLLDVRSPAEYNHAHIPGAYSLPLFSDEERKVVGTLYKQESREAAIKAGLDFFGPKMRKMIDEVETLLEHRSKNGDQKSKIVFIYCWRGGMRSAGVAWLLDLYGFRVYTLSGGYKRFRNYVLDIFREPFSLRILGGYTGSGKTEVLKEMERRGEAVVDLEKIACHKGSAFGNIGMPPQPTQEMFENRLALELKVVQNKLQPKEAGTIWIEDESQRIGLVNIPGDLWKSMRLSPIYFLDIPFEKRLQYILLEYGNLDRARILDAIDRISQRLGNLEARLSMQHLQDDNTLECFRILLKYYDKWYLKALHNREGIETLLTSIPVENVTNLNAKRLLPSPAYENH